MTIHTEQTPATSQGIWPMQHEVLDDALDQAFPYAGPDGPPSAREAAWSARVQTALNGMDAADPDGLDVWMQRHAESAQPHEAEAELVAGYETLVREEYGDTDNAWDYGVLDDSADDNTQGSEQ